MTIKRTLLLFVTLGLGSGTALAEKALTLSPEHPESYTVQQGDTLWDLAGRFLTEPWRWTELWQANPAIADPNLIFPGDTLVLTETAGRPGLRIDRQNTTVKLSPRVRASASREAIPTIPLHLINQFLDDSIVLQQPPESDAAYVIEGANEHVVAGGGDRIYVRNLGEVGDDEILNLYRVGEAYVDPVSGENLGYGAIYVGGAVVEKAGDPATLFINRSVREVLPGDVVIPQKQDPIDPTFLPRAPEKDISGQIISVLNGVSQIGQHQVVVLNRGEADGLQKGHVLFVEQAPGVSRDPRNPGLVALPTTSAGQVMVFRVFDRVSFALVMSATRAIHLLDPVITP